MSTQFDLTTRAARSRQFGLAAKTVKSSWLDLTTAVACLVFDLIAVSFSGQVNLSRLISLCDQVNPSRLIGSGGGVDHLDFGYSIQID